MPIFLAEISKHLLSTVILSSKLATSNQDVINWLTCVVTHSICRNVLATSSRMSVSMQGSFERSWHDSVISAFICNGVKCEILSSRDWLISRAAGVFAVKLVSPSFKYDSKVRPRESSASSTVGYLFLRSVSICCLTAAAKTKR